MFRIFFICYISWNLIHWTRIMSYKNKGKTYVRAYRNKWIAPIPEEAALGKKGRSVPAVQIQVGVIQPSGMVKMSSKFLSLHPEFAQQDWYYLNHDLVDENTFFDQLPAESVGFPNKKPVEENVAIEDKAADGDLKRASEILCPWDNRSPPNGCIQ